MTLEESYAFRGSNREAWRETSYWLGSAENTTCAWVVDYYYSAFGWDSYNSTKWFGLRPIIII